MQDPLCEFARQRQEMAAGSGSPQNESLFMTLSNATILAL